MYGLIVLALAWAPGLLVLVMILSIKICFVFKLKLPIHFRSILVKIHSGASVSSSQAPQTLSDILSLVIFKGRRKIFVDK